MSCACPTCGGPLPTVDGVKFDLATGVVCAGDAAVRLPPKQAEMFAALLESYPHASSKAVLMDRVYGLHGCDHPDNKVLSVMKTYMNKRLKGVGVQALTVWGRGYRLDIAGIDS